MLEVRKKGRETFRLFAFSVLVGMLAFSNILIYMNLQNKIFTLNDEKFDLESQVNTLRNNYATLNFSFHALNASYFHLQSQYSNLQTQYEEMNASYFQLQNRYYDLRDQYEELDEGYATLQAKFHDLNVSYFQIRDRYYELLNQYEELSGRYATLQASYQYLQSSFSSLKQSYISLQRDFEIEKALRIGNSLESYYDLLRQELGPTGIRWWWTFSESIWQAQANFAADLALHDLRLIYWPSIEQDYYQDVGEYSYDTAKKKIDEIVALIEVKSYDAPTEKIRKILDFVNRYIHYESEVNDVFLAPVETLGYKSGDCDDFTILVSALFEYVGIDAAIGFFRNQYDEYHAMVLVHLENLAGYGYWYYTDLTSLGLESGRWIIIEPQTTIDEQGTDWISQWIILVAAPLDT